MIFMLIGLISDTHITEKRGKLSEKIAEEFKKVDLIVHAETSLTRKFWMSLN